MIGIAARAAYANAACRWGFKTQLPSSTRNRRNLAGRLSARIWSSRDLDSTQHAVVLLSVGGFQPENGTSQSTAKAAIARSYQNKPMTSRLGSSNLKMHMATQLRKHPFSGAFHSLCAKSKSYNLIKSACPLLCSGVEVRPVGAKQATAWCLSQKCVPIRDCLPCGPPNIV